MNRHISGRRLSAAALIALLAISLVPASTLGTPIPARAALLPVRQFVGDSVGRLLTFRVRNTGIEEIGSVRLSPPSSFWTVTACPSGPAGWTRQLVFGNCEYSILPGAENKIPLNQGRYFKLRATTGPSDHNVWGTWRVQVSPDDDLAPIENVSDAAPMGLGLRMKAFTFEVVDAVISDSGATAADPCPAADKSADAGSTGNFLVVCGRNHANTTLTPVDYNSKLLGSMIASHGAFTGGPIPSSDDVVVLGYWSNVTVTANDGAGKALRLRVGAADNKMSPVRRIAGFVATEVVAPPDLNDAPVLDPSKAPALVVVAEDPGTPSGPVGTPISTLVDLAPPIGGLDNVADPDGPGLGIAIVGGASTGTLWYSTNNGASWTNGGAPSSYSDGNALLLAGETGNNRVYYEPAANVSGIIGAAMVIHAWDESTNTSGTVVSISASGGTTAFSANTDNVGILVNAINDAPVAVDDVVTVTVNQSASYAAPGILDNDTDADADSLTAELVAAPAHGSFTLSADGAFTYMATIEGDYFFTYKAKDATAESNTATVIIHVLAAGGGGGGGGGGCFIAC